MNNKGSVSIEAAVAFPLFLFTILAFIYMGEMYRVKETVYEGLIETAEYMAEYAYLTDTFEGVSVMDYPMAMLRFEQYVDNKALLEKYVVGGSLGISLIGSSFPDDEGYIDIYATYYVRLDVPIIGIFKKRIDEHIKQRAYLGSSSLLNSVESESDDKYVFVAENATVYHSSRSCTYLMPDIVSSDKASASNSGYRACEYCGGGNDSLVYITTEGECYHSSRTCSRLKRTVSRKKLSEVSLPPCSKCGD
ncbi:TadE-like protein [Lachnospiraceae bacterium NE2001]|nr:TadE-like protein [Lachnospiraceae bacterium NE2001]